MGVKPFLSLAKEGKLAALLGVTSAVKPLYRVAFLAAAQQSGVLRRLAESPATAEQLATFLGATGKSREALDAWLELGRAVGALGLQQDGYTLRGLAKKLARPENDAALAMVEEIAGLHHKLISETPQRIRTGQMFTLADQDGEMIARSSRVLEAFQVEALRRTFPRAGETRLLEIGCGSATYIRHAAELNPALTAVGLELQPEVADAARKNIAEWNLESRVEIASGDVRERQPDASFDIATLYNNIYYFPVAERAALLRHIAGFLKPGGFLLAVTCCQGGSLAVHALNLWGAATTGAGRLPSVDEMTKDLRAAGFNRVEPFRLAPGESFFAFKADAAR